jgi:pantoate kinase
MTVLALAAPALAGCSSINEKVGAGMGDMIPQWAGGLPANAPPRPGTAEYDRFMQERERQRQMPAAERDKETQSNANAQATVPGR